MASYNNENYKNDFFNSNGIYFNSTSQTTSTTLDEKYLQKSGRTINGSLDFKTNLILPIGNIGTLINDLQENIDFKKKTYRLKQMLLYLQIMSYLQATQKNKMF